MYLIANVGGTGTGKSTLIKTLLKQGRRIFIFDVQNEYTKIPFFDPKNLRNQMRYYGDFSTYLDICELLPKGFFCVIEEATGVFDSKIGLRFTNMILSKRHTGKTWVVNFHLMQYIPPKLVGFIDVLVLRKTGDIEKNIKSKFPQYLEEWKKILKDKDRYVKKVYFCSNLTMNLTK